MDQIGLVGLSYRHAGSAEVARFTIAKDELTARLPALAGQLEAGEILYLATCNRVEVLYTTHDGRAAHDGREPIFQALTGRAPAPGEAARVLRAWAGEAAIEHLFLVACGLDSARTGERDITSQLRSAWQLAREAGSSGPTLNRMLGEALGLANRVHRLSAERPPSLADMATERVLAHVTAQGPGSTPVALVGVSPMTRRCGLTLARAGVPLLVVNRTLSAAQELACEVGGQAQALADFRERPARVAAVVLAAGGGSAVLGEETLTRLTGSALGFAPLLIDFGVPPNVEPEAARRAGLDRIGMDDLNETAQERRIAQLLRLAPVRAAIDERLTRLREELAARAFGPQLSALRTRFEGIVTQELGSALDAELKDLDAAQRAALQKLGVGLARRLAHLPLAGLRAAAAHAGPEAIEAFFREARLSRPVRSGALYGPLAGPILGPVPDSAAPPADIARDDESEGAEASAMMRGARTGT